MTAASAPGVTWGDVDLASALASAPTVPLHPRVSRIALGGRRYVANRRPAALVGSGADRCVQALAAAVDVPGNGPLAEPVLHVHRGTDPGSGTDQVTTVCEDLGTRWPGGSAPSLHESLHGRWSTDLAAPLGAVVGHLHRVPVPAGLAPAPGEHPVLLPLTPARWAAVPDPVLSLARQARRDVPASRLDAVRAQASGEASGEASGGGADEGAVVVHGDLKPDNVLLVPDGRGGTALRLIDFERAGRGRCSDDLAAVLAGVAALSVQEAVGRARDDREVRAAVGAGTDRALEFFAGVAAAHARVHAVAVDPGRLVLAAGARLLARAQSIAAVHGSPTAAVVLVAGLATALLTDPGRAATALSPALSPSPDLSPDPRVRRTP